MPHNTTMVIVIVIAAAAIVIGLLTFNYLHSVRAAEAAEDDGQTTVVAPPAPPPPTPSPAQPDKMIMVLGVTGYFDTDESFEADPWYSYLASPAAVTFSTLGDYSVVIYDHQGRPLSTTYFEGGSKARVETDEGPKILQGVRIPINIIVKFHDNAAKIAIENEGEEIYSRQVSANTPEVSFTGLTDYQELSNNVTLTWEASDADDPEGNEELYFNIYYCNNDVDYHLVAGNATGRTVSLNLSDHPGTNKGFFYIYATDGVRTTESKSPFIKMPFKAPSIITNNSELRTVKITEEIYFPVEIKDAQDGWLTGTSVSWILDGEEVSITHVLQSWPYQLPPGKYTYTCVATNSGGVSASKEYMFEILNDESDLPDDWSRQEIIDALKEGYIIPLTRIESPTTRGQIADLAFMLFYYIWPEGLPYYDATLVTDCGADDYSEFMMTYLGIMEAPGGLFEPQKSVTQREAMLILYKSWTLASHPGMTVDKLVYTEKEVRQLFLDHGVFDEAGPNTYQPDERLPKKLALVWINRLDNAIFDE